MVDEYLSECDVCAQNNVRKGVSAPIGHIPVPEGPLKHLVMDYADMIRTVRGKKIFVIVSQMGIIIGIVVVVFLLLFCCIVPFIRSMLASAAAKQMINVSVRPTGIDVGFTNMYTVGPGLDEFVKNILDRVVGKGCLLFSFIICILYCNF